MRIIDVGYWTLARLKAIVLFLGATATFATTVLDLPTYVTGVALVLTFIGTYAVPNATVPPEDTAHELPVQNDGSDAATWSVHGGE